MANTQALCTSFKKEILNGHHAFGTSVARAGTTADNFKAALYYVTGSLDETRTAYGTTAEVTGTNYTAGGVAITATACWIAPATSGTTAYSTPPNSIVWTVLTIAAAFDAVLLYNSTQSNKAVSVHTFGSQTITAGTLTLTMPTNDNTNALIRLA